MHTLNAITPKILILILIKSTIVSQSCPFGAQRETLSYSNNSAFLIESNLHISIKHKSQAKHSIVLLILLTNLHKLISL